MHEAERAQDEEVSAHAQHEPATATSSQREKPGAAADNIKVSPSDVAAAGCAAIAAGAIFGGVSAYRSGSRSLMEDGVNPSNRLRMIPVAAKTLIISTLFTGVLGGVGFTVLKSAGVFSKDVAELPSAKEAARMLRTPRAYFNEVVSAERSREAPAHDGNPSSQNDPATS